MGPESFPVQTAWFTSATQVSHTTLLKPLSFLRLSQSIKGNVLGLQRKIPLNE
jgi:hypothetical protein